MEWYGMVWNGMEWYGMVWNGMEWYGMVWNGVEWYGMVWNSMEVSRTFDNVAPGFLALGKLVLEELRHLVADLMGNAVLRQEAAQEPKLCRFVFSQRSQASNEVAHCTDQRSRSYERPERNYAVQDHLGFVGRLQRALADTQLAKTPEHTH